LRTKKKVEIVGIPGVSPIRKVSMSSGSTRDHVGSHAMHAEQMLEVALIAGEYDVAVVGEQRDVSIHHVVAPCPCAQLPDGP
jgi:hypothetical protein